MMLKVRRMILPKTSVFIAVLASVLALGLISCQEKPWVPPDGFTTEFSSPPFQEGKSVLGIDGWVAVTQAKGETTGTAILAPLAEGGGKTGLLLQSSEIEKRLTGGLPGRVRVTAVFNFSDFSPGRLIIAPIMGGEMGIFSFGYQAEANESNPKKTGFFYSAQTIGEDLFNETPPPPRRHMLVPRSDLIKGQSYTVTADINFQGQSALLSVTGQKADGTPLQVSETEVSFMGDLIPYSIEGFQILGGNGQIFLESVSIQPIQE